MMLALYQIRGTLDRLSALYPEKDSPTSSSRPPCWSTYEASTCAL
jgi:hypothetical protein